MERTLFIAINLPEHIRAAVRNELELDRQKDIELYQYAQMTPEESWHLTVKFLGNQSEKHIDAIEKAIHMAVENEAAPEIAIRTLATAPPHRPPRMIWATPTTETNRTLEAIKKLIEKNLAIHSIVQKGEVFPTYNGHITLARFPEGRKIAERIVSLSNTISFKPETIDLMESHLETSGAKYAIVRSIDFKRSI